MSLTGILVLAFLLLLYTVTMFCLGALYAYSPYKSIGEWIRGTIRVSRELRAEERLRRENESK